MVIWDDAELPIMGHRTMVMSPSHSSLTYIIPLFGAQPVVIAVLVASPLIKAVPRLLT